jgi:hypothetical protein
MSEPTRAALESLLNIACDRLGADLARESVGPAMKHRADDEQLAIRNWL